MNPSTASYHWLVGHRQTAIARAGAAQIVPTGCWATLQPKEAGALPNVLKVVPNAQKDNLVPSTFNLPPSTSNAFDLEPISRQPLPGLHRRTRAFIKVQDGCDNHCTFCITTLARGQGRSRPVADVRLDIRSALNGGTKEVVLTGVHLGSWGQDFGMHLRDLIRAILRGTDVPRRRLSSLEPWDLDAGFFSCGILRPAQDARWPYGSSSAPSAAGCAGPGSVPGASRSDDGLSLTYVQILEPEKASVWSRWPLQT